GVILVFITPMSFMSIYAAERFSVNDAAAGFGASAFVAGGALSRVVLGKYLDFIGSKSTLVIVLVVFVVCALLYPLTDHDVLLLLVRVIHGAAFGIASTSVTSVAITLVPVGRLGEGLGYMALAGTVSNAVGPLAAL